MVGRPQLPTMQRMPDGSFAKARALLVLQAVYGGLAMWAATTLYVVVEDGGLDGTDRARAFSLYGWMRGGPYVVIALLIVGGAAVAMLARRNVSSIALQWSGISPSSASTSRWAFR